MLLRSSTVPGGERYAAVPGHAGKRICNTADAASIGFVGAATATVLPPRIENPDVTEEWLLTIAHIDLVVRLAQP